jgi:prepilin peptidase dependent protein B
MLDRKQSQKSNGYSLIEVLIAASLGAIIVMTAQQLLQWQRGAQHSSVSKARFTLNGQAVAETFLSSLSDVMVADVQNPEHGCYVFPTQNGGSVGFRVRSYQLQHNPMTLDCAGYGWQSLTDSAQFNVRELRVEADASLNSGNSSKLFITLLVSRDTPQGAQEQQFNRTITVFPQ